MPAKTKHEPQNCRVVTPMLQCPRKSRISFVDAPSRTRQEFKDECDINNIMAKYFRTGVITHVNKYQGQYGECPSEDFQLALETVRTANDMFGELPAELRRRFENDPAQLLAFMDDERNREEAALLGLIEEPRGTLPQAAPPDDEAAPQGDETGGD